MRNFQERGISQVRSIDIHTRITNTLCKRSSYTHTYITLKCAVSLLFDRQRQQCSYLLQQDQSD